MLKTLKMRRIQPKTDVCKMLKKRSFMNRTENKNLLTFLFSTINMQLFIISLNLHWSLYRGLLM